MRQVKLRQSRCDAWKTDENWRKLVGLGAQSAMYRPGALYWRENSAAPKWSAPSPTASGRCSSYRSRWTACSPPLEEDASRLTTSLHRCSADGASQRLIDHNPLRTHACCNTRVNWFRATCEFVRTFGIHEDDAAGRTLAYNGTSRRSQARDRENARERSHDLTALFKCVRVVNSNDDSCTRWRVRMKRHESCDDERDSNGMRWRADTTNRDATES